MPRFDFVVTLETDTREQAEMVLAETLDADVEFDFEATLWGWEITGDPDGYGE